MEVTGGVGFYKFNNTSHDLSNWGINGLNDVQFANNRPRFNFDLGVSYKRFGLKFNFFQWGDTCLEPYNSNHFFNNLSLDLLFFPLKADHNITPYLGLGIGYCFFMTYYVTAGWYNTPAVGGGSYSYTYQESHSETLYKSQYLPLRAGLLIRPFKGWVKGGFIQSFCLKVEESYFFYNKRHTNILDGRQTLVSIGWLSI